MSCGEVGGCPLHAWYAIGDKVYRAAVDASGRYGVYGGEIERITFTSTNVYYTVIYKNGGFKEYEVDPLYLFRKRSEAKHFVAYWRKSHNCSNASAKKARQAVGLESLEKKTQDAADAAAKKTMNAMCGDNKEGG